MRSIRFLSILAVLCLLSACAPIIDKQDETVTIEPSKTISARDTPTPSQTPAEPDSQPTQVESTSPPGPLIEWQRSGGIAGLCRHLTVYADGRYIYSDCRELITLKEGKLSEAQMEPFLEYAARYTSFRWEFKPPKKAADMFVDWYIFNGAGAETPSQEVMQAINNRLAMLTAELASSATRQGGGMCGKAMIEPHCSGPMRQRANR